MKILIVTAMFPPIRTGTSHYSRNLAEALRSKGCDILVVTVANSEASDKAYRYRVQRLPALHIPLKNYFKHLRFSAVIPGNYRRIKTITENFGPDTIILINHYLDIAFLAIHAAKKLNIPLYVSIGTQLQSLNKFRDQILRFLDRLIVGNLVFPSMKRIVSWDREIDRYIREVHNKKNSSKSLIIPFGINGDLSNYRDFDNQYGKSRQILGVGAVIGHRDYIYQIKVFKRLLESFPDLKFKIIGNIYNDKSLQYASQLGISDRVAFTGELSHDQVLKEYKNSILHWMMLNGRYVGLGTSTIEAMLMGVPVVSNVPADLIEDAELMDMQNYIYSDGKNIESDFRKISLILQDRQLRKAIGQNGKEFVEQNLNWDIVADKYMSYIAGDCSVDQ